MKTALIVEGGGMRGIFAAGVLEAFLEQGFDPFDGYIGVSSGACLLSSFVAGQPGRNRRILVDQMRRPPFISGRKFLRGGHYMDLDWLWESFIREDPLDVPAAVAHDGEFLITVTDCDTGKPAHLTPDLDTCYEMLKASSALPVLYRGGVSLAGRTYVDGGVTDPIPAREAARRGAEEIVVIRSQPRSFPGPDERECRLSAALFLRNQPLHAAMRARPERYRQAVAFIRQPARGVRVHEIAPPEPLQTGRTGQDISALDADYDLGLALGRAFMRSHTND